MAHRMQITLEDSQLERLRRESERTGASIAELVRRAIDTSYQGALTVEDRLALLERGFGAWADREDPESAERELRALRTPLGPLD